MKEYFVLTDTHSFFNETKKALDEKQFDIDNPEHIIIHCGDMFDRGLQTKKLLNFFYDLYKKNRFILVLGNHEELFQDMIKRGYALPHDKTNKTLQTLGHLQDVPLNTKETEDDFDMCCLNYDKRIDELINHGKNFYETKNHIFVHGWIPVLEFSYGKYRYDKDWRKASKGEWHLARCTNGMKAAEQGITIRGKTIVCGHYSCSYGNIRKMIKQEPEKRAEYKKLEGVSKDPKLYKPYEAEGIIAFDGYTDFTGVCNCLHFIEEDI